MKAAYKRILLKLSGEVFSGEKHFGIDPAVLDSVAKNIAEVVKLGVQVAIVIGGGNLFRGKELSQSGISRVTADHMGMLATTMNALALRDALERIDIMAMIMSSIPMTGLVDPFVRRKAIHRLGQGRVVIFSGGTGNPLFTTDAAASLRAIEIDADVLMKATNVDGIYSADPATDSDATLYKKLGYQEVLERELGVMDLAAFCQCRDFNVPLRVFRLQKKGALMRAVCGEEEGTLVTNGIDTSS